MSDQQSVLVVEDNDFVRMQIVKFLQDGGYHVIEATSSSEGMDAVHQNPALVCMLVDVRMEPEDGFDFLAKLRAEDIQVPAILVTGDNNPDILSRGSGFGVVSVLMKPVNKDRLLKMVERAIMTSGRVS